MRFKGDRIVVTTMPHQHIEVPLTVGLYQKRFVEAWKNGELTVGEITLLPDRAVVVFKKMVEEMAPKGYASVDINLMSLDVLKARDGSAEYRRIDLRKLYGIRVHYFEKRGRIQSLSKYKPITSKRLARKYSKREKRRVNDMLHKISTSKTCPRCGRLSKTNGQAFRCRHCGYEADRHFVACVNMLRMWGLGFAPKALDEMIEREGLGGGNDLPRIST